MAMKAKDWGAIQWKKGQFQAHGTKMNTVKAQLPIDFEFSGVGVDPGRNFAIAFLSYKGFASIYYGNLHLIKDWGYFQDGIQAYHLMMRMMPSNAEARAVIGVEGAAFSKSHGEANLAYVRMGFLLGGYVCGFPTEIVAINTARKSATGDGRKSLSSFVPSINGNAADALGVALHVAGYRSD